MYWSHLLLYQGSCGTGSVELRMDSLFRISKVNRKREFGDCVSSFYRCRRAVNALDMCESAAHLLRRQQRANAKVSQIAKNEPSRSMVSLLLFIRRGIPSNNAYRSELRSVSIQFVMKCEEARNESTLFRPFPLTRNDSAPTRTR